VLAGAEEDASTLTFPTTTTELRAGGPPIKSFAKLLGASLTLFLRLLMAVSSLFSFSDSPLSAPSSSDSSVMVSA
jgi:hypothetical protein